MEKASGPLLTAHRPSWLEQMISMQKERMRHTILLSGNLTFRIIEVVTYVGLEGKGKTLVDGD
jgi:hypothetical protein